MVVHDTHTFLIFLFEALVKLAWSLTLVVRVCLNVDYWLHKMTLVK
jgi:hypothetical protein